MRVYISADMEGISGVVHPQQTEPGQKEWERFRRLMTAEVNACVEGALRGGAERIVVNDSHWSMRNILLEELHERAELISGAPKPLSMMTGIDEGFDAAIFLGYHGMAGTAASVIDHTYTEGIADARINGRSFGEAGINAALAGYFGVPVVMVTGDQSATGQAQELLGDIEVVTVKHAVGRYAARCLPVGLSRKLITEAAERAVRRRGEPFRVSPPVTLEVTFHRSIHADYAAFLPGAVRRDGRTLEFRHEDYLTVFKAWRAMGYLAAWADV